jgi:monofunctional biosynthetic peptidoglycan transglycosylase
MFLLCMVAVCLSIGYYLVFPRVGALQSENPPKTSFMQYREREWEAMGKKVSIRQVWVPLSRISPYLIKAVLIAEDDKFRKHEGFDFEAIQKAVERDLREKKLRFGGSTVSQQLAKNLYLTPSRNPVRKLKEAILTWRIERALSKKRILEIYLNVAEWGEGIFGAEAAARHYFGKSAIALTPMEAARLAAVLPNPRRYSPVGTGRYVERRSRVIHSIMVRRGVVAPEYEETSEADREGEHRGQEGEDAHDSTVEGQIKETTSPQQ